MALNRGPRTLRRLLAVGTNYPGDPAQLSKCVQDATRWAEYFADRGWDVTLIRDAEATRTRIIEEFRALVDGARVPADRVVFFFSGHGTEVRDLDGDEVGGRDQAIVPVDYRLGRFLTDDDLRGVISEELTARIGLTVVTDCCYSGSMTRFLARAPVRPDFGSKFRRPRFLPGSPMLDRLHAQFRLGASGVLDADGRRTLARVDSEPWTAIGACREDEVAWEDENGGVFTEAALSVLRNAGNSLTAGGFMKKLLARMGPNPDQTPTLDAPTSEVRSVLFGSRMKRR